MTPDGLSDLLACVAAFGRSLDESFDPTRFLAEFALAEAPASAAPRRERHASDERSDSDTENAK